MGAGELGGSSKRQQQQPLPLPPQLPGLGTAVDGPPVSIQDVGVAGEAEGEAEEAALT